MTQFYSLKICLDYKMIRGNISSDAESGKEPSETTYYSYRFCSEPPPHIACPQALEVLDKAQPPRHQRLRLGTTLQKTAENQLGSTYLVGHYFCGGAWKARQQSQ